MVVGASGFTAVGYPKAVPRALAARAAAGERLRLTLMNGGSVGDELDGALARAGVLDRRYGFQNNRDLRAAVNAGAVRYVDIHVGVLPLWIRSGLFGPVDVAVLEAAAIDEAGNLIPGLAVGITDVLARCARRLIVEVNADIPLAVTGLHDIYTPAGPPHTQPIPLTAAGQRIGLPYVPCDPEKIAAVVLTHGRDTNRCLPPADGNMARMAGHIIAFLKAEQRAGRLTDPLPPLQSGVGGVANAVLTGLARADFRHMTVFTEVMQDAVLDLMEAGLVDCASGTALTVSPDRLDDFYARLPGLRDRIVLRPQEISNAPELIRRLGVVSMNTAIEADLRGNVNSSHIGAGSFMNGIGGAGDYCRNAGLSIFTTASTAKNGAISCIVPEVAHVDHTEHDTQVIVTEQGLADLRGLTAGERAECLIENCAHPDFRGMLRARAAALGLL